MPHRLHRLLALCLALIWGPATLCCTLEAAGYDLLCSTDCHSEEQPKVDDDGCAVVESGNYQSTAQTIKTAPTILFVHAALICWTDALQAAAMDARPLCRSPRRPQDWVVNWHFVRRAAAPAHAPDGLIA